MSFTSDTLSSLLANKQKRDAAAAAVVPQPAPAPAASQPLTQEIPAPSSQPAPIETPTGEAVPTKKPDEAPKPEKPKPETPAPTEQTNSDTTQVEQQEEEFKWDDGIPDTTNTQLPGVEAIQVDLRKIGSALKLEVKNEDELVTTVNQRLARLQELEKLSLDGIPDELKQAVEVAKKGGDWLTYTKAVGFDASQLIEEELFDREYRRVNAQRFKKADGTIDLEALDQAVDSIDPGLKFMQGQAIKSALVQRQQFEKAQVIAQVTTQQENFQRGLGEAANNLGKLIPQEQFGVTIEPRHSSFFYQGISDGSLVKKHLGNLDSAALSKFDSKKLMRTLALAELGEKISTLRFKQGETSGKKSLLKEVTNPQMTQPSFPPRPESPTAPPEPTSAQRLAQMQERNKPKNSL